MNDIWPKMLHRALRKKLTCGTYESCRPAHAGYAQPQSQTVRQINQVPIVMKGSKDSWVDARISSQLSGQANDISRDPPVLLKQENLWIKRDSHVLVRFQ